MAARLYHVGHPNANNQKHFPLPNNNNINNINNNIHVNKNTNSNNVEVYEAEDDQGDDDVFETEPVKSVHVVTNAGIKNNNSVGSSIESNNVNSYKNNSKGADPNAGTKIDTAESEAAAAAFALNKRRTQSCSALQAAKDPQSPLKVNALFLLS